jgi:hypothetical protein
LTITTGVVRLPTMADAPRLLHRYSQHGYTTHPGLAMRAEGEAVSAAVQAEITARAHRTAHERELLEWARHRQEIENHLRWLTSQRGRSDLRTEVRAASRMLDRVDRKLREG